MASNCLDGWDELQYLLSPKKKLQVSIYSNLHCIRAVTSSFGTVRIVGYYRMVCKCYMKKSGTQFRKEIKDTRCFKKNVYRKSSLDEHTYMVCADFFCVGSTVHFINFFTRNNLPHYAFKHHHSLMMDSHMSIYYYAYCYFPFFCIL